jgi:hypothetical protein
LLAEPVAVRLHCCFHVPDFAVVLLEHISSFQQLVKRPFVENWFVLLIGHDFSCPPSQPTGDMARQTLVLF